MKKKIFAMFPLWIAAVMMLAAAGCSKDGVEEEPGQPDPGQEEPQPIVPPVIDFVQKVYVDETGEWPVASVAVNLSSDTERWFWKFDETRGYQDWTMLPPSRRNIEFPVLRSGDYTLSVYAEKTGAESEVKSAQFSVKIPEKYGEVFAAIDYTFNAAKDKVKFRIETTEATEKWYWEFAEQSKATTFDGEITSIPSSFTAGSSNEFEQDFEINTTYKMTVIAENGGGRKATSATVVYDYESDGEPMAAVKFSISDDKEHITFTVTTTAATEAWYYEFAPAEEATKLPETVTSVPAGFTTGTDKTFTLDYSVNKVYTMSVIAERNGTYAATTTDISTEWSVPVMEIAAHRFDYIAETYHITLKPSSATTKYYYYFGNIDAVNDGGMAGGDPYSIAELEEMVARGQYDDLKRYGFVEATGNAPVELEYEFGTGKDYRYNNTVTPYGMVAFSVNRAGASEVKSLWPVSPQQLFYSDPTIEVTGPWTVNVSVHKGNGCSRFVIGAMPSKNSLNSDGNEMADGYDESRFISDAEQTIQAIDNGWTYVTIPYALYSGQWNEIDEMHLRYDNNYNNDPHGVRLKPETEYTVAIYAIPVDGDPLVLTYTFQSQAFATSDSTASPKLTVSKNEYNSAVVTIDGNGASRIFYGYSQASDENLIGGVVTDAVVEQMFSEGLSGTYFAAYTAPVEFEFRKNNRSDTYIVWAVAVDDNGNISHVSSQTVEPQALSHDSAATVTSCEFGEFESSKWNDYVGNLHMTLGLTPEVAEVRIVSVTSTVRPENVQALENWLVAENGIADRFSREEVLSPDFSIYYAMASEAHWFFAMAVDAEGNFGPMVNLADLSLSSSDRTFLNPSFTHPGPFGPQGGDKYWLQTIAGSADGWLIIKDIENNGDMWNGTITWNPEAAGNAEAKHMYLLVLDAETQADEIVDKVKTEFKTYSPDSDWSEPAGWAVMLHSGSPSDVKEFRRQYQFGMSSWGAPVYVTVLVDADGNLTMKAAAYVNENSSTPTYVDLTDAL